jgi:hypothetical protein
VMFAAYNAGPGQVDDIVARGTHYPAETRSYVAGINRILHGDGGPDGEAVVEARFTRPDGSPVLVDPIAVTAIRAPGDGEYPLGVRTIINTGKFRQGVQEDMATVSAAIRLRGGSI